MASHLTEDSQSRSFDPVWDRIYRSGLHGNRYPWDAVVSFVFRYRPRERKANEASIIEIGCGTGPNLWFAAREGFHVSGIDASEAAIADARARFAAEGLRGDFRVGEFSDLPFENASFDLGIDRAALTCTGDAVARKTVAELGRVLRPGGAMFCNVYSDRHSSRASGRAGPDGITSDISSGTLTGVGQIRFYDRDDLLALFVEPTWTTLSLEHVSVTNAFDSTVHAEWRLIARRN
jgi:SAM-dependent methyltransferase